MPLILSGFCSAHLRELVLADEASASFVDPQLPGFRSFLDCRGKDLKGTSQLPSLSVSILNAPIEMEFQLSLSSEGVFVLSPSSMKKRELVPLP